MAYSSVKKPAFYIPVFDYLQGTGGIQYKDDSFNDIHLLNPTKTHRIEPDNTWTSGARKTYTIDLHMTIPYSSIQDSQGYIYIFVLGHNLKSTECTLDLELIDSSTDTSVISTLRESIVNDEGSATAPTYNGFTIYKAKFEGITDISGFKIVINGTSTTSSGEIKLGCISLCSKWNPPHNPDLSLGMTRQYDGVKTTRTKGGATLSNAQFTRGGTFWNTFYAWELTTGDYPQTTAFNTSIAKQTRQLGRRIWSMNFSYLKPENIMPETETFNYYETEYDSNVGINILDSDSFFARVLNRVQGSHLPFIFQPNDTDNNTNPDQWAIVRFDQKDFTITQAAPDLYSLSMKLTESW